MAQAVTRGPVTGTASAGDEKRKPFLLDLYSTAVGKKYVMAITGHHRHRLRRRPHGRQPQGVPRRRADGVYDIDLYGEFLRELLVPLLPRTVALWLLRLVLIGALVLHLHAAYSLTIINRRARPVKYQSPRDYVAANFASRTMRWTGIIVLLFLVWHLADLTWGWFNPDFVRGEVYRNVDASLSRLPVAHPLHRRQHRPRHPPVPRHVEPVPVDGLEQPAVQPWRRGLAAGIATIIVVGNVSFPIAVLRPASSRSEDEHR